MSSTSCMSCGTALGPNHGVKIDPADVIEKRMKLDAHMQVCHPDRPWTPISPDHLLLFQKRGLARMLLAEPEIQLPLKPRRDCGPPSIVDGPCRNKVRKIGGYSKGCVEFWEKITNKLLFLKHRDADTMWSLLIRFTCSGFAAKLETYS